MNLEFYIGLAMGALFIGAVAILIASRARPAPSDIAEWQAAAYEPPREPPRVVTRLKKNDLFWEIET